MCTVCLDPRCIKALRIDFSPIPHSDCDAPDYLTVETRIDKVCQCVYVFPNNCVCFGTCTVTHIEPCVCITMLSYLCSMNVIFLYRTACLISFSLTI